MNINTVKRFFSLHKSVMSLTKKRLFIMWHLVQNQTGFSALLCSCSVSVSLQGILIESLVIVSIHTHLHSPHLIIRPPDQRHPSSPFILTITPKHQNMPPLQSFSPSPTDLTFKHHHQTYLHLDIPVRSLTDEQAKSAHQPGNSKHQGEHPAEL